MHLFWIWQGLKNDILFLEMLRPFFIMLLTFLSGIGYSQNIRIIDSLKVQAHETANDSIRAKIYYDINYQWAEYNFDSAWHYALKVEQIGKSINNHYIIRTSLNAKGIAYDYQNRFDSAIYYYDEAGKLAYKIGDLNGKASSIFNKGVVHSFKGEMELAITEYNRAGVIYNTLGNQRMLAMMHNNLGIIYRKTGKYELARDAYSKSLLIKSQRGDETGMLHTLTNLSTIYQYLEDYEASISTSKQAVELAQKLGNTSAYLHELVNLANAYQSLNDDKKASNYFLEAEKNILETSPYETKIQVYNGLAYYYLNSNNLIKAKAMSDKILNQIQDDSDIEMAHNTYYLAFQIYSALGKTNKALEFLEKAYVLKENLLDNEVLLKTTELEQIYEKEKREIEIAKLNAESNLKSLTISNKNQERNAAILLLVFVAFALVLLLVLFIQKKRSLSEKEILLKEIHHRVKNNLQVISSLLNLQARSLNTADAKEAVKEGQARVNAMALIHQRLYSADDVRGVDVQGYLESLGQELFNAYGIDAKSIDYDVNVAGIKLDIDTVIPLGLIINELITNCLKYAFKGSEVGILSINMEERNKTLHVSVTDNGKGINKEDFKKHNSFGWRMINSLGRKLKTEININTENGTRVELLISRYKLVS